MGQVIAKKQQSSVFLIFSKQFVGRAIAEGLTEAGYSVSEYQTAREFLIDKRNHKRGVVLSEIRLARASSVVSCRSQLRSKLATTLRSA